MADRDCENELVFNTTALVIGAGAHVPYGFPTGSDMMDLIRSIHPWSTIEHSHKEEFRKAVFKDTATKYITLDYKGKEIIADSSDNRFVRQPKDRDVYQDVMKFIEALGGGQTETIDSFLARRDDLSLVGKYVIGMVIKFYEDTYKVNFVRHDWIQKLIQQYIAPDTTTNLFFKKPPVVITFNYDTLFERSFEEHLVNYQLKEPDDAKKLVEQMKVYHVYGKVGEDAVDSINTIKVVGEEREPEKIKAELKEKLMNVDTLYFLGFGFDNTNASLIFDSIPRKIKSKNIYSTNVKMTTREIYDIKSRFNFAVKENEEVDCLELIEGDSNIFLYEIKDEIDDSDLDYGEEIRDIEDFNDGKLHW